MGRFLMKTIHERERLFDSYEKVPHCAYQDQLLGKCKMSEPSKEKRKISGFF